MIGKMRDQISDGVYFFCEVGIESSESDRSWRFEDEEESLK